ncbi:MAG: BrnT family toxin [Sulfurospirillum cavolei]|nr:BrnT family toxin [Sulfurospirillum cavolei]
MKTLTFEWDQTKAASNLKKHGISFEEAKTIFDDENARFMLDPDHSENEERFILLGMSYTLKILTVVHCYRDNEGVIRIISARKSTKNETKQYKEFLP